MSAFLLKLIAMLTMLIDHSGHYLLNNEPWTRFVGRTAFILYAFMAAEGLKKTHNKKRYLFQLLIFALVSTVPFRLMTGDYSFSLNHNNVGFTLLIGTLILYLWEMLLPNQNKKSVQSFLLILVLSGLGIMCSHYLGTDYAMNGVLLILLFYFWNREHWTKFIQLFCIILTFFLVSLVKIYKSTQFFLVFSSMFHGLGWVYFGIFISFIPLAFYNGQKGYTSKWFKNFYWWFYPLHMLLIWFISLLIR